MYGDIILKKNPANYEEAIKTFAELPSTMGDKESGYSESSPVKMQLTPISEVQSIIYTYTYNKGVFSVLMN